MRLRGFVQNGQEFTDLLTFQFYIKISLEGRFYRLKLVKEFLSKTQVSKTMFLQNTDNSVPHLFLLYLFLI